MQDWKGEITVISKNRDSLSSEEEKISTKVCPCCKRNKNLLLISTYSMKACTDCYVHFPWFLEPGQKPLYS